MKKVVISICACIMVLSFSFAEETKTVRKDYELKNIDARTVTGTLKSVIPADLSRPNSGIILSYGEGKEAELSVKPNAVIYDGATGKLLSLKEIMPGEKIQVNYTVLGEGLYQAKAVKVLPEIDPKKTKPGKAEEGAIK